MSHIEISRAKINLSLRILGRRADGFHELITDMIPLELADQLHFQTASSYSLCCNNRSIPTDERNLITKAVRVFEAKTGSKVPWQITLDKMIPHGAGLAGGSSNASATLRALNMLQGTGFTKKTLVDMASEIGSDCAFFMHDTLCRCSGRGEQIEPLVRGWDDPIYPLYLVLLKPSFGVSTPEAFRTWSTSSKLPGVNYDAQATHFGTLVNDLEIPVFAKYRFLAEMKHWLMAQEEVSGALMSGSGSTLYAVVKSLEEGERVRQHAIENLDPNLWSWVGQAYRSKDAV